MYVCVCDVLCQCTKSIMALNCRFSTVIIWTKSVTVNIVVLFVYIHLILWHFFCYKIIFSYSCRISLKLAYKAKSTCRHDWLLSLNWVVHKVRIVRDNTLDKFASTQSQLLYVILQRTSIKVTCTWIPLFTSYIVF